MSEESRIKQKTKIENCILTFEYLIQRTLSSCILDTLFDILQFIMNKRGKHHIVDSRGGYRSLFLRSIAQFLTQIYMNCFVSS